VPVALEDEGAIVGVTDTFGDALRPVAGGAHERDGCVPQLVLDGAERPAWYFRLLLYYLAGNREEGEPAAWLTKIAMRSALRGAATWQRGAFIEQLDGAQTDFWQEVRQALIEVREEMHATV
jgi:hypothetical protein